MGLGGFSDSTQCSEIPSGDPYRKPGNYCATPDGGITTFNADGTTYRAPGYAVDPDPAHPVSSSSSGGGGLVDTILRSLAPGPGPGVPMTAGPSGMSTTTLLLLAAGGVALALALRR